MSTQDKTEQSTTDGGVGDLGARLAATEAMIASLQGVRDREIAASNYVPTPAVSAVARTMAEHAQLRRLERLRAYEAEVEAARVQAVKDAPKRAKRDREIAVFDERLTKLRDEGNEVSRMIREVTVARQAVAGKPL